MTLTRAAARATCLPALLLVLLADAAPSAAKSCIESLPYQYAGQTVPTVGGLRVYDLTATREQGCIGAFQSSAGKTLLVSSSGNYLQHRLDVWDGEPRHRLVHDGAPTQVSR